jgi:rubrerythrin
MPITGLNVVVRTLRVIDAIRSVVGDHEHRVLYECRHCGTRLEDDEDPCPNCGTTEIATFVM